MSLSKLNINWRLVVTIGTPIAVLSCLGIYYYKKGDKQVSEDEAAGEEDQATLKDAGNKLFKLGKYEEALEKYTQAIEFIKSCEDDGCQGQLEMLFQNRAAVFEKLGSHVAVIRETTSALELNPRYIKALYRRSRAYKATGFLDEALEDITAVCILEQFSSPSSVQLADDILRDVGAREGQKLIKEREPPISPSKHSVEAYLRGWWNCPVARVIREGTVSTDQGAYNLALTAIATQNYDDVIPLATTSIEKGENLTESYYLRGTFRFLYGYAEETLEDLERVIKSADAGKEARASALIKRASYFSLIDEGEACEKSFEESEAVWEGNVDLWHHRGQVLLTRTNLPEALRHMTRACELEPSYGICVATKWYVQYRLAGIQGNQEDQSKCVREFQKLLKKFESSPDVFSLYGQILMENSLYEEAELHFQKVLDLDPLNASVVVHKAMSRFQRTGDPTEAIEMLKDAVKIDERNEFIFETLGTLHLQIGNLEGASKYITKALGLARSIQELTILSSLKKAAEVQKKVKDKLGITSPPVFSFNNK